MEFEWDPQKAETNLQKHGVSFMEAAETFADPQGFQLHDREHSASEERFYWVGKSESGRVLTTRFVRRINKVRIFGSGEWREFKELYDEKAKY